MSITEFLLARIAEDAADARAAIDPERPGTTWQWFTNETDAPVPPGEEVEAIEHQALGLRTADEFPVSTMPGATLPAFIIYEEDGSGRAEALAHIARHDPARVLAACEAKRRIVERAIEAKRAANAWTHERLKTDTCSPLAEWARWDAYAETLRIVASEYVDHPDYREEWRI